MRKLFTYLLLFGSLSLSAQNSSTSIVPLGYDGESKHFLKKENKTAIYDVDRSKIIFTIDGSIRKKEILLDRYLVYYEPFDKDEKLKLVDLQGGSIGDYEFSSIKQKQNMIYGQVHSSMDQYILNQENNEWYLSDEWIYHSSNVKGWEISMQKLKYKDHIIDKSSKSVIVNATSVNYFNKCGPYLLYLPQLEMVIDTNGNAVRVDKEIIKDDLNCYNELQRIEDFNDLVKEVYGGEEYKGLKRFNHNNNIYFQQEDGKWKYRDNKGSYYKLPYNNLKSRYDFLFGELKDSLYLLNNKHETLIKLGSKFPSIKHKKYLHIKDKNAYYDLLNSKFLTPEQNDAVHMSKKAYGYKQNNEWHLHTFETGKTLSFEADKVNSSSLDMIEIESNNLSSFLDWDGNYLFKDIKGETKLYSSELLFKTDDNGKSTLAYLNGKKVDIPNFKYVLDVKNNIVSINYNEFTVLDEDKSELYEIPNLKSYNKLGISFYEDDGVEFRDFEKNIIPKELDIYEKVRELLYGERIVNPEASNPENHQKIFEQAIELMDRFLVEHPNENEILKGRVQFGLLNLANGNYRLMDSYISRLISNNPQCIDLPIYKNIIKGAASPEMRSSEIKNIERIMQTTEFDTAPVCIDDDPRNQSKEILQYYLGYLYHLEGNVEESLELKERYFKSLKTQNIPVESMNLY